MPSRRSLSACRDSLRTWVVLVLLAAGQARADGGAVQVWQADGSFVVTVFAAPTPLRAGPVDLSVLVQRTDSDAAVLNADVLLTLMSPYDGALIHAAATQQQATNKLLYAAALNLPVAGVWDLRVAVRSGSDVAHVGCPLDVAAALPPLLAHWPYLAFPPLAVLLFALHQWRRSRSSKAS